MCFCARPSTVRTSSNTARVPDGAQLVACNSPVGRLGLTVCYDLRFPAVYQELVYTHGAEVLLVPSAFTVRTGALLCHMANATLRSCLFAPSGQQRNQHTTLCSFLCVRLACRS